MRQSNLSGEHYNLVAFDASTCASCGKSALVIQHSPKDSTIKQEQTINISCAVCEAIRPFFQNPTKCTVCGWELGTSASDYSPANWMQTENRPFRTSQKQSSRKRWKKVAEDISTGIGYMILLAFGFTLLVVALSYFRPEQDKLADQYHVSKDKVIIERKPYGCDYEDAPLGNKHCHYEKSIDPVRACDQCKVTAVYLSWRKVED
jgi:hypothetical protein